MSSIIIKGMEMPKEVTLLAISPDGTVDIVSGQPDLSYITLSKKAISISSHGRLIDADALLKKCEFVCTDDDVDVRAVRYSVIDAAPTIIPAEEGE